MIIELTINGNPTGPVEIDRDLPLLDFLHDHLGLTGTKFCCGIGVCRACTVSVQRQPGSQREPVLSCSTPASSVNGYDIRTVEGIGDPENLSSLQAAFLDHFAFQCGYCTPGFLIAADLLLERLAATPIPETEVDSAIEAACGAHLCRCTGYIRYYRAIKEVVLNTPGLVR